MALIEQFDTPASLRDLPESSPDYEAWRKDWHNFIARNLSGRTGSRGGEFYDPSEPNTVNLLAERSLVWMAFPRRLMVVNNRDNREQAFIEGENRDRQEEYCEWRVTCKAGKITKVVFVTESPEYWEKLWSINRSRVVELYRRFVDPTVTEDQLSVVRMDGMVSYNRFNRWNTTDGIMHCTEHALSLSNELSAAFDVAQRGVNWSTTVDNYGDNPGELASVDPRVKIDIGMLARKGLSITLREPIGLYIAGYDDTGWTKPDGSPVDNYWRIVRGRPGQILRLEYEVPRGAGFVVGDIRIGGRPIEYGGQIAEHITVMIGGVAGTRRTR